MVVEASKYMPASHTHEPPTSTRLFTHTHNEESVDPVPDVVERDTEQASHDPWPDESLKKLTSHDWHVSVEESNSYPASHTHTPPSSTNDGPHSHDDKLDDPAPDVDMCESGQAVHDPRSADDL